MKIKILGSGAGKPENGKHNPAIYVNIDNQNFIFDAGDDLAHRLLENKLDGEMIDAIFISHFHADHIAGIFLTLQLFSAQNRTKPLKLFIPEQIGKFLDTLDMFYLFPENLSYNLTIFKVGDTTKHYYNIIPFESIHLKRYSKLVKDNNLDNTLKSYSFLIEDNNKTIIYTSDIVNLSHINDELAQADFIIVDGLHIELEEIERLQKFEGLQIIITHYSFDSAEKLKQIVNANPQISFANEKELIEIL